SLRGGSRRGRVARPVPDRAVLGPAARDRGRGRDGDRLLAALPVAVARGGEPGGRGAPWGGARDLHRLLRPRGRAWGAAGGRRRRPGGGLRSSSEGGSAR